MNRRPWPLVILALVQVLNPAFNLILSASLSGAGTLDYIRFIRQGSWLDIFESVLLMPLAGAAVFAMKRWSYPIFIAAVLWTAWVSVREWRLYPDLIPLPLILGFSAINLALVGYFLLPAVRRVYLDPRIRWWEAHARYEAGLPGQCETQGQTYDLLISNISEGGVFAETRAPLSEGSQVRMHFDFEGRAYPFQGTVRYRRELVFGVEASLKGYGIQFSGTRQDLAPLRQVVRKLDKMGAKRRPEKLRFFSELWQWLKSARTFQAWLLKR